MKRENVFSKIYRECNSENNLEKWKKCMSPQEEYPKYIDVELTNCCNIHCYMCPVGTCTMRRKQGFMTMELVEKIYNEVKNSSIRGIRLIRWGEPTMHPQFLKIIQKLKETGKAVHFNTNGTLLNRESIQRVVDLEIDSVKFSFQGVDRESYEEMRSGSSWDTVMENLYQMNAARAVRGGGVKPYIQVSTTVTTESKEQVEAFRRRMMSLCDYLNIGQTKLCHLDIERMRISDERKKKYLELRQKECLHKRHLDVCPEVYDKLSVNWDGTVTACCADYDNMLLVGDLNNENLKNIYQGEKINRIREIISRDAYEELPLCRGCYQYIELQK